jgi:hypothetical protein
MRQTVAVQAAKRIPTFSGANRPGNPYCFVSNPRMIYNGYGHLHPSTWF